MSRASWVHRGGRDGHSWIIHVTTSLHICLQYLRRFLEKTSGRLRKGVSTDPETSGLIMLSLFISLHWCAQVSLVSFALLWYWYHKHPFFPPPSKGADPSSSGSTISVLGQPGLPNQSVLFHYFWQKLNGILPNTEKGCFTRSRTTLYWEMGWWGHKQQVWVDWGVVWVWTVGIHGAIPDKSLPCHALYIRDWNTVLILKATLKLDLGDILS